LGCFHLLAFVNSSVMNVSVKINLGDLAFNPLDIVTVWMWLVLQLLNVSYYDLEVLMW
jgi:hypothetical protein